MKVFETIASSRNFLFVNTDETFEQSFPSSTQKITFWLLQCKMQSKPGDVPRTVSWFLDRP